VEQKRTCWEATVHKGRAEVLIKKRLLNFCCVNRRIPQDPINFTYPNKFYVHLNAIKKLKLLPDNKDIAEGSKEFVNFAFDRGILGSNVRLVC